MNKELKESLFFGRVNFAEVEANPRFLITNKDKGALSRGSLHAIKGEPKSGKGQLATIFAAVTLGAKFGRLEAVERNLKVALFDTMQSRPNVQRQALNVHRLLDWDVKTNNPRFECYALRADDVSQRRQEIIAYIQERKPDLAIIDELMDLTYNMGDINESQPLINELTKVATETQCAILLVLNEYPRKVDYFLEELAEAKCVDVFKVTKNEAKNAKFSVSKENYDALAEQFKFTLDANGTPEYLESIKIL